MLRNLTGQYFEDGRPGIEYKQNCMQSDTTRLKGGPETGFE